MIRQRDIIRKHQVQRDIHIKSRYAYYDLVFSESGRLKLSCNSETGLIGSPTIHELIS